MTDDIKKAFEKLEKGYQPLKEGHVQGGHQPEKNDAGAPPTGGGGGKEPEKTD